MPRYNMTTKAPKRLSKEQRKPLKVWTVKAIDVLMRDARMPFWKLTREVQASTRADALAAAQSVIHSNCKIVSVSIKRATGKHD